MNILPGIEIVLLGGLLGVVMLDAPRKSVRTVRCAPRRAPLIFANCFLPFLYGRNLYLLYKHKPIVSPGDTGGK